MILNETRVNLLLRKFSLKIAKKSCCKGLEIFTFTRKRSKPKHVMKKKKKKNLKGNITTTYIEHRNKNTGTNVLIHLQNVEQQKI